LKVQSTGDAFSELTELPLTFPPTYKFGAGVDNYDTKRRPAWTDRILYQVNANVYDNVTLKIEGLSYKSHMHYRASDHRPVTAGFKINVFRPTVEKLVEFHDPPEWYLGESNKVFYRVCSTLEISPEDWIAIYKADFTSLDEYLAYAYVPSSTSPTEEESTEKSIVFSENSITFRGSFVLVYFSRAPRSVYGISTVFESVIRT
jgi:inositol-1,4,5-trisphosphate 5-phosphatase